MEQKVVVHFRDGRLLKGFARQPSPNHPTLDVVPLDQRDQTVSVRLDTLKAVFFVKDFIGDSVYSEDKHPDSGARSPSRVRFHMEDGEELVGDVEDYQPDRAGFFLTPVDSRSNNLRCFVVAAAIKRASMG
jgi:hypothetical protein